MGRGGVHLSVRGVRLWRRGRCVFVPRRLVPERQHSYIRTGVRDTLAIRATPHLRNDWLARYVPLTIYTEKSYRGGDMGEGQWVAGVENNLTRDKRRKRKCVLASQPEDLSPPVTDSDSVVEP